jgi:hypothetical protein
MKTKIILLVTFLNSITFAGDFSLENVSVQGTGCPADQTVISMSPEKSVASLIFQGFGATVPNLDATNDNDQAGTDTPSNGRRIVLAKNNPNISHKVCNIRLDVRVPQGKKLDGIEISYDMRGNALLEQGIVGKFKSFLVRKMGLGTERIAGLQLMEERLFDAQRDFLDTDIFVSFKKMVQIKSDCNGQSRAQDVNLHIQHYLGARILPGYEGQKPNGTLTLDSTDVAGNGVTLKAIVSNCGGGNGRRICRVIRDQSAPRSVCESF